MDRSRKNVDNDNGIRKKRVVIGISGGTNSGKTCLVDKLVAALPSHLCSVMHLDDYYVEPGDKRLTYIPHLDHHNWDELNAIEMDRIVTDVKNWKKEKTEISCKGDNSFDTAILIVEGILLFNYRKLEALFDKKYFITISDKVCRERRSKRSDYVPADVPMYYDDVVWPCYQKYLNELQQQKNIVYHDGTEDKEKIFSSVYSDIETLLK